MDFVALITIFSTTHLLTTFISRSTLDTDFSKEGNVSRTASSLGIFLISYKKKNVE